MDKDKITNNKGADMITTVTDIQGTKLIEERATPKQKARDILLDSLITKRDYWVEESHTVEGMTQREIDQVQAQLDKEVDRLRKKWNV